MSADPPICIVGSFHLKRRWAASARDRTAHGPALSPRPLSLEGTLGRERGSGVLFEFRPILSSDARCEERTWLLPY